MNIQIYINESIWLRNIYIGQYFTLLYQHSGVSVISYYKSLEQLPFPVPY